MIFKIVSLLVTLFVLGFAFFWMQLRPTGIRTECAKFSDDVKFAELNKSATKTPEVLDRIDKTATREYSMCLHRKGL